MKKLFFIFFSLQAFPGGPVFASDSSYVLLQIRRSDQVSSSWDRGQFLQQQLIVSLQHEWRKKSIAIILADDSDRVASTKFDYAIEINVLEVQVNEPIINTQNKILSRNVHSNTYKDETEDMRKLEATVSAEMVITEKSVTAILRVSVSTIKLPEAITDWTEIFAELYKWENNTATYTGSFQALSLKDLELVKAKPKPVPSQEDIFREIVRQCINKSSRKIANSLN